MKHHQMVKKYERFYKNRLIPNDTVDTKIHLKYICSQNVFLNLADYVMYLRNNDKQLNTYVPNSHISEVFDEVICAMIIELYHTELCQHVGLAFKEFAERDFNSINHLSEATFRDIIHNSYQKLRERDNEIRNNLKLMDVRLYDIVMPIKTMWSKALYVGDKK